MAQFEIRTEDEYTMQLSAKALGLWNEPDQNIENDKGSFKTGGVLLDGTAWAANIYGVKRIQTGETTDPETGVVTPVMSEVSGFFGILSVPDTFTLPTLPDGVTVIPLPSDSPIRFS